jgi:hypothetical protein
LGKNRDLTVDKRERSCTHQGSARIDPANSCCNRHLLWRRLVVLGRRLVVRQRLLRGLLSTCYGVLVKLIIRIF